MIPQALADLLRDQYGEAAGSIVAGYGAMRPVTFRFNRIKGEGEPEEEIAAAGISCKRVPWYGDAFIAEGVREEGLRQTALYENGKIYLQSLSSMLPPLYLAPEAGESILDMAAAPGGKTTELYALSGGKALITACERDAIRFERLKFNLMRQGATRVTAMKTDATTLDDAFSFDKILLDAPCTGSGTIAPKSPVRFSENYLARCVGSQKKLLQKALRLLKKGGELVYSTCSVLRQENEEVLESVLGGGCVLEPLTPFEGLPLLPSAAGTVCVRPTELYEGFFVAKIKKI